MRAYLFFKSKLEYDMYVEWVMEVVSFNYKLLMLKGRGGMNSMYVCKRNVCTCTQITGPDEEFLVIVQ